jgi:hypothetical protein
VLPRSVELDLGESPESLSDTRRCGGDEFRQALRESGMVLDPDPAVDFVAHFITPSIDRRPMRRLVGVK